MRIIKQGLFRYFTLSIFSMLLAIFTNLILCLHCDFYYRPPIMFQYSATSMFAIRSSVAKRPILGQSLYDSLKTLGILKPVRGGVKHREKLQGQGKKREHTIITVGSEHSSVCLHQNVNNKRSCRSRVNANNLVKIKPIQQQTDSDSGRHDRLNFLYLNDRSVGNKTEAISSMILDEKIDICCITETWLHKGDTDTVTIGQLSPAGYSLIHEPRVKRGGGVAVLCKDSLRINKVSGHNIKSFELLGFGCQAGGKDVTVTVCYRPPSGSIQALQRNRYIIIVKLLVPTRTLKKLFKIVKELLYKTNENILPTSSSIKIWQTNLANTFPTKSQTLGQN